MFESLHRKCLCEDVCYHILCGAVMNFNYLPPNWFPNEVVWMSMCLVQAWYWSFLWQQWQIDCCNTTPSVSSEGIECPLETFGSRSPPLQHGSQRHIQIQLWIMRRELASLNSTRLLLHPCRKCIQRLHVNAPVSFHLHRCILQFQINWFTLFPLLGIHYFYTDRIRGDGVKTQKHL